MSGTYNAPFTVHIRVVPKRGSGKRFEIMRELQRLAVLAFDALSTVSGLTIAQPGGGQARQYDVSDMNFGTAVKPQFGETPAQLMLTGFWSVASPNTQPVGDTQRVFAGQVVSGPAGYQPWIPGGDPTAAVATEVKSLVAAMNTALTAGMPSDVPYGIFRLDYKGIVWGDAGRHFPV